MRIFSPLARGRRTVIFRKERDMENLYSDLAFSALAARAAAYSPYSGVTVGAALLGESGKVYLGANIENASYSLTTCAERVAIFKAVSEGERRFTAIAIAGGRVGEDVTSEFPPCGACRQVLREFCSPDFKVLLVGEDGYTVHTLEELLPYSFTEGYL